MLAFRSKPSDIQRRSFRLRPFWTPAISGGGPGRDARPITQVTARRRHTVDWIKRRGFAVATILAVSCASVTARAAAQDRSDTRAYLRAVAEYFQMPEAEVSILADWNMPSDEIPVALFVASRAGVSPEALVALRSSGRSWVELTRRYQVGAGQLHVPFARPPSDGLLVAAYEQYQSRQPGEWAQIALSDEDIVALVNVRVLSAALGMRPDEVLARRAASATFADVYARIIG